MTNKEKYDKSFTDSMSIDASRLNGEFAYSKAPEWDSIAHMALVAALEDAFGISLDTDDIVDFSSYHKGVEILKKYKVEIVLG